MGVWDSVRNVANRITGSAAEVSIDLSSAAGMPGDELTVQVEVVNGRAVLDVRMVVIDIEATEHITLHSVERALDEFSHELDALTQEPRSRRRSKPLTHEPHSLNVHRSRVRVGDAYTLGAGERKSYTARVRIPADAQPTYHGTNVRHVWHLRARLDILGTDPSSGWSPFVVGKPI